MNTLLEPITLGDLELSNRVVMAPLTRARCGQDSVPTEAMKDYYGQRGSAGLIISEAVNISSMSCAFEHAPGLFTEQQTEGWKPVTAAVHEQGGKIVAQLWHGGRVGALGVLNGEQPLSPSGFNDDLDALNVWALLDNQQYVRITATPSRAMTLDDIQQVIGEYRIAAMNAKVAGFDGVEIHAANGYLPHQFLSSHVNRRTDHYGGSTENRIRFVEEIADAIMEVFPAGRIGVRVSPYAAYNSALDDTVEETYARLAASLDEKGIAYIHAADMNGWFGAPDLEKIQPIIRNNYSGAFIANGGIDIPQGKNLVQSGYCDLIAYGRYFIANPDLVKRIATEAPLNDMKEYGLYAGGNEGYTDYPAL